MEKLEQLKDIKNMQYISIDFTSYIIYLIIFLLFILFSFLIYFYIKNSKKKLSQKEKAQKYLKSMNYNRSSKDIAYDFTIYAKICINEKFEDEYNNIVNKLEVYKYKKDVKEFDDELLDDIKEYIRVRV